MGGGFYLSAPEKLQTDVTTHPIEGFAREGNTPFKMPLISHVRDNLWQGGCIDGVPLPSDFQFVLSLYDGERYVIGPDTFRIEVQRMPDSSDMQSPESLYCLARVLRAFMLAGKTLVHCQAGLNRSSLLAGLALIVDGMTPVDAIALLRERRSPACLCNRAFETWLLAQPI